MIENIAPMDIEKRSFEIITEILGQRQLDQVADGLSALADPGTFPRLQIDATVQYLVGRAPTADDLKIDDPYNTYLYNGLPPGPIANPGIASLEAALYPADTSYYYYVARSDGSHIFSKTLDEHNAAIAEVNAASDTDEDENGEG